MTDKISEAYSKDIEKNRRSEKEIKDKRNKHSHVISQGHMTETVRDIPSMYDPSGLFVRMPSRYLDMECRCKGRCDGFELHA